MQGAFLIPWLAYLTRQHLFLFSALCKCHTLGNFVIIEEPKEVLEVNSDIQKNMFCFIIRQKKCWRHPKSFALPPPLLFPIHSCHVCHSFHLPPYSSSRLLLQSITLRSSSHPGWHSSAPSPRLLCWLTCQTCFCKTWLWNTEPGMTARCPFVQWKLLATLCKFYNA